MTLGLLCVPTHPSPWSCDRTKSTSVDCPVVCVHLRAEEFLRDSKACVFLCDPLHAATAAEALTFISSSARTMALSKKATLHPPQSDCEAKAEWQAAGNKPSSCHSSRRVPSTTLFLTNLPDVNLFSFMLRWILRFPSLRYYRGCCILGLLIYLYQCFLQLIHKRITLISRWMRRGKAQKCFILIFA